MTIDIPVFRSVMTTDMLSRGCCSRSRDSKTHLFSCKYFSFGTTNTPANPGQ